MGLIVRISSVSFVLFYVLAACIHVLFVPTENFFCDLFHHSFITRFFAIVALIAVSITIASFFIWFANQTLWSEKKKYAVKITGVVTASLTVGIFSKFHDELLLIASIVGVFPVIFVAIEISKQWKNNAPALGLLALGLLSFYNIIFYLNFFETGWPILQKISILLCLIWVNFLVIKRNK
ncbi:MAG: hypothetical protein CMP61_01525 [Flavobacteriales bacterium]|nr:hypothetical protein [Flavobacteriales bacterium]|tara:strand:- start:8504 stop:9043 length:540 start_codon:yes stop_codon:yes gene_type:complete